MSLSKDLRDELKSALFDIRYDNFRDCLREYIQDGVVITGLNEMTDEELVREYADCGFEEDELLGRCIAEMEMDKLLNI